MDKQLTKNFLNKELADLAHKLGETVIPEQSMVIMDDVAKVKVKEKKIVYESS